MKHALPRAIAFALVSSVAQAQDIAPVQKLFEVGKYNEVAAAAAPADAPKPVIVLAAQGLEKLQDRNAARAIYKRLVDLPESDPWHFHRRIGNPADGRRHLERAGLARGARSRARVGRGGRKDGPTTAAWAPISHNIRIRSAIASTSFCSSHPRLPNAPTSTG